MSEKLDVKEAIDRLREKIDELKVLLEAELTPEQDDLWLLRYLLSHKENVKEAEDFARRGILYRKENASWLQAEEPPDKAQLERIFVVASSHAKDGSPIFVNRSGASLQNLKNEKEPYEAMKKFVNYTVWMKEKFYRECDEITRRTGKLTKMYLLNDMTNLFLWLDPRIGKGFGESSKVSEILHPQLIENQVFYNPPVWISLFFNFVKPFLSKRSVEKMRVCTNSRNQDKSPADCPFVTEVIGLENLPQKSV